MLWTKKKLVLIVTCVLAMLIPVMLLVHFCPTGKLYDAMVNQCVLGSTGWKITGYFTPLETDYTHDKMTLVYVKGLRNNGSFDYVENNTKYFLKEFRFTFINEVNIQGAGITSDDKIIQTWLGDYIYPNNTKTRFYHYESCEKTSSGLCLYPFSSSLDAPLVMVAVSNGTTDLKTGIISHGTLFNIPDIPSPWNVKTFWAVDTGEWNDKHVDIYTGSGLQARVEAERITKLPPEESGTVQIIGFKSTNSTR